MKNASEKPPIFSASQAHAIDIPLAVNQAPATVPAPAEVADLGQPELYINRELSLLEFNRRVLELAKDESILLLERLKFLCICSINLDEFKTLLAGQQWQGQGLSDQAISEYTG